MRKNFLIFGGCILILFGLFVPVTATLVTFIVPKTYASSARIVSAEVEKISSDLILGTVITNLDLAEKWGEKFRLEQAMPAEMALAFLQKRLEIRLKPKSSIIDIVAYSDDRIEASAIANEIAVVYQRSFLAPQTADGKSSVQIIDVAEPANRPVRPNTALNISLGCAVGLIFCGLGVVLFLFSRRRQTA